MVAAQLPKELGTDPNLLLPLDDESSRSDLFSLIEESRRMITTKGAEGHAAPNSPMSKQDPFDLRGKSGQFVFPFDALYDGSKVKSRGNSLFGIDISHHTDPKVPFPHLSESKVSFVYAKATQGTRFKDGAFSSFWKALEALPNDKKVHRGAYHFLTAGQDPADQAATFLKFISANGGLKITDMPPVLDLEWETYKNKPEDQWKGHEPDQIVQKALTWLRIVKQETGRTPLLYTSYAWWRERGIQDQILFDQLRNGNYGIWIADYSRSSRAIEMPELPSGAPWALWQFTNKAKLPKNYNYGVDATIFKGTEQQFYEIFGLASFQLNTR